VDVTADTSLMDLEDARAELDALEVEERQVSAERRRLHQQIDNGFATEATRLREREVSDHRRELHRHIDALRERIGLPAGPRWASACKTGPPEMVGEGMFPELGRIADAWDDAVPEFANDSERLER